MTSPAPDDRRQFERRPGHARPVTFPELFALPTVVDLTTAGHAVGISVRTAYKLVAADRFPCRVLRLGHRYQVPTLDLMRALGVECPPVYIDDVERGSAWASGRT